MLTQSEFEHIRVIVFGSGSGARYRAGRSVRILKTYFDEIIDATAFSPRTFADCLHASTRHTWLLRAGAWPANMLHWHALQAGGRRSLCALGALLPLQNGAPKADELLRQSLRPKYRALDDE